MRDRAHRAESVCVCVPQRTQKSIFIHWRGVEVKTKIISNRSKRTTHTFYFDRDYQFTCLPAFCRTQSAENSKKAQLYSQLFSWELSNREDSNFTHRRRRIKLLESKRESGDGRVKRNFRKNWRKWATNQKSISNWSWLPLKKRPGQRRPIITGKARFGVPCCLLCQNDPCNNIGLSSAQSILLDGTLRVLLLLGSLVCQSG